MDKKYTVQAGTIARTIILALALVNQILSVSGHPVIPISDETIEMTVSYVFTVVVTLWSWWKNNSFTQAALRADQVKDEIKAFGKQVGDDEA